MKTSGLRTIVLARHGQTDFNIDKRVQGPEEPRLTELGHQQAKKIGEKIKRLGLNFDAIICANMNRTKETLAEIFPEFDKMNHVKIDLRLNERYHKDLVGKNKEDIEKELSKKLNERLSYHLYFEGTKKSEFTNRYPNNESLNSVDDRLTSLLNDLKDRKTILLLGSSVFNQYILERLLHGTTGNQMPQTPEGNPIDFQENNELRIITLGENIKVVNYSSNVIRT